MAYKEIPEGSVEIQTGLWLYTYIATIGGVERTFRQLFSSSPYCFYDSTEEVYDRETGELIPEDEILPEQRIYMTWMSIAAPTDISVFVSVIAQPGWEIVSLDRPVEVA